MEGSKNISGPRIRKFKLENNLAQVDLAVALSEDYGIKLDQSDISEIERQVRLLKDFELDAIAHVLNVDPIFILRGDR